MTVAKHQDRSVFEMRARRQTSRARFGRLLSGTAVTGCLLLGAGGVYLGGADGAWAVACTVTNGGTASNGNLIRNINGPQQCEQVVPAPQTLYANNTSYNVTIQSGAQVTTTGSDLYVGAPGYSSGVNSNGGMLLNIDGGGTSLTVNGDMYIAWYEEYFFPPYSSPGGWGDVNVTNGASLRAKALYSLSGPAGQYYGNLAIKSGSTAAFDTLIIGTDSSVIVSDPGSQMTISGLTLGPVGGPPAGGNSPKWAAALNIDNYGVVTVGNSPSPILVSSQYGGTLRITNNGKFVNKSGQSVQVASGAGTTGRVYLGTGGTISGGITLGAQSGFGLLFFGGADLNTNQLQKPGNAIQEGSSSIVINGSSYVEISHTATKSDSFRIVNDFVSNTDAGVFVYNIKAVAGYTFFRSTATNGGIVVGGGTFVNEGDIDAKFNVTSSGLAYLYGRMSTMAATGGGKIYANAPLSESGAILPGARQLVPTDGIWIDSGSTLQVWVGNYPTPIGADGQTVASGAFDLDGSLIVYFNGNAGQAYPIITGIGAPVGSNRFGSVVVYDQNNGGNAVPSNLVSIDYGATRSDGRGMITLTIIGSISSNDYYWNGTSGTGTPQGAGGSGTWNATNTNWVDSSGNNPSKWESNKIAYFSGAAGTVTVASNINIGGMTFATAGYVLNAANGGTLQFGGPVEIDIQGQATLNVPLIGTTPNSRVTIVDGILVLTSQSNSYTGDTVLLGQSTLQLGSMNSALGKVPGRISSGSTNTYLSLISNSPTEVFENDITSFSGTVLFQSANGTQFNIDTSTNDNFSSRAFIYNNSKLNVTGKFGNHYSNISFVDSSSLSGNGSLGNVILQESATLNPGDVTRGSKIGKLTMYSLATSGETLVTLDITGGSTDVINITAGLNALGAAKVNYAGNADTTYILINYAYYQAPFTKGITVFDSTNNRVMDPSEYKITRGSSQLTLLVFGSIQGQDYYWNGGNGANPPTFEGQGGSGTWNATNSNWTDGIVKDEWSSNPPKDAYFANGQGVVTVASDGIIAAGLHFGASGYRLTGKGIAITPASGNPIIEVSSGATATIDLPLSLSALDVEGGGTLIITKAVVQSGGGSFKVDIDQGELQLGASGYSDINQLPSGTAITGFGALTMYLPASQTVTLQYDLSGLSGDYTLIGAGNLTIPAAAKLYSGDTTFNSTGTMSIAGTLGGTLEMSKGTLTGSAGGYVSGTVTVNNATLNLSDVLKIDTLTMNTGSSATFAIGGITSGLANVTGGIDLSGSPILTVTAPASTYGAFPIVNYAGNLTGTFASNPTLPSGAEVVYDASGKQVLIVIRDNGQIPMYWNGQGTGSNGLVGGNGTWSLENRNWSDKNGAVLASWVNDGTAIAYFAGSAGTVTVAADLTGIEVAGMSFMTGGYLLTGDGIGLVGTGSTVAIDTGAANTASEINLPLGGTVGLAVNGSGTLILSGESGYSGATTIAQTATLQLGSTNGIGSVAGTITGAGDLVLVSPVQNNPVEFDNDITGLTGDFTIKGPYQVNFQGGASTYAGTTTVSGGIFNVVEDIGGKLDVQDGTLAGNIATLGAGGATIGSAQGVGSPKLSPGDLMGSPPSPIYGYLTFGGDLTIGANAESIFEFSLENTGTEVGNDLVAVTGLLTLGGKLTATVTGDYGDYVLFTYGSLTSGTKFDTIEVYFDGNPNPLVAGQYEICPGDARCVPLGLYPDSVILTIVNAPAGDALYWNGGDSNPGDGTLIGGNGTWNPDADGADTSWADSGDTAAYPWTDDRAAYFAGTQAGVVTVNNTFGGASHPIYIDGLVFETTGYTITGGTLTVDPDINDVEIIVKNPAPGTSLKATLDVALVGPATDSNGDPTEFEVQGGGLLVITNNGTGYAGNMFIQDATVQMGTTSDSADLFAGVSIAGTSTLDIVHLTGSAATAFSGQGTITIHSASVSQGLELTGDSSAFDGDVFVYSGGLSVTSGGKLALAQLVVGGVDASVTVPNVPSLTVDGSGSSITASLAVTIGDRNDAALGGGAMTTFTVSNGGTFAVTDSADLNFGFSGGSIVVAEISGAGSKVSVDNAQVTIGKENDSKVTMKIHDGGALTAVTGDINIGDGVDNAQGAPAVSVQVYNGGSLSTGDTIVIGSLSDTGPGSGILIVGGNDDSNQLAKPGAVKAKTIHFGGGAPTLEFNHTGGLADNFSLDADFVVGNSGQGVVDINHVAGFTTYLGDGSAYSQNVNLTGGTLNVSNSLGGTIKVTGGTLAGVGTVGSKATTVTVGGGTGAAYLSPGDPTSVAPNSISYGTLSVAGNLLMTTNGVAKFDMTATENQGGSNDLVAVTGTLATGGALEVDIVSPSYGHFLLFTAGQVDDTVGFDKSQSVVTFNGQQTNKYQFDIPTGQTEFLIYVYDTPTNETIYWNGNTLLADDTVHGGNGTWTVAETHTNWTDQAGDLAYDWKSPNTAFFGTIGGTVTVDGTGAAPIQVTGMTFDVDGYSLVAKNNPSTDAIGLVAGTSGQSHAPFSVASGATAKIGVVLKGSTGLSKQDEGTLVLTGDHLYGTGTQVVNGTLQLGDVVAGANGTIQGMINISAGAPSARLVVEVTGSSSFANVLAGAGTFLVGGPPAGLGTLDITGDSRGFTGNAFVYNNATVVLSNKLDVLNLDLGEDDQSNVSSGTLTLKDDGVLAASGQIYLAKAAGSTGTLNIGAASGQAPAVPGRVEIENKISFGDGTAKLVFNHTYRVLDGYDFGATMASGASGATDSIEHYSGFTSLGYSYSSGFVGMTTVYGGTLHLSERDQGKVGVAILGGPVVVKAGGTFGGTGIIANTVTVEANGTIENYYDEKLVTQSLSLDTQSEIIFHIDYTDLKPSSNDETEFKILTETLTLPSTTGSVLINIVPVGGQVLPDGQYKLIAATGQIAEAATIFQTNDATHYKIIKLVDHEILLAVSGNGQGEYGLYWNPDHNATLGGTGDWTGVGGTNWSASDGTGGAAWRNGATAYFQGTAGTVTVDSTSAITVAGMKFSGVDYTIKPKSSSDALTLDSRFPAVGIDVAQYMLAQVDVPLTGAGGIIKTGQGVLGLGGANTYTGGTAIEQGTLRFSGNASLKGSITVGTGAVLEVADTGASEIVFNADNILRSPSALGLFAVAKTGKAVINSDSSNFIGETSVAGTLSGAGRLGGKVTIDAGGTLAGSVVSGIPFAAGDTLVVSDPTSTIAVTLNPQNPNTFTPIFTTSTLSITAGVLDVLVTSGDANNLTGNYLLISYETLDANSDPTKLNINPNNPNYLIVVQNNNVYLQTQEADNYYWNPFKRNAQPLGGNGIWQAATTDLWSDEDGGDQRAWLANASAVFEGDPGTVTVDASGGDVIVGKMTFNVDGYEIVGKTTSDELQLGGAQAYAYVIVTNPGDQAVINIPIADALGASVGLAKDGSGELVLSKVNHYKGDTLVSNGTLTLTQAGAVPGDITINQNGTFNWNDASSNAYAGVISGGTGSGGTFNVNLNSASTLQLSNDSSGFNGATNVNSGTLNVSGPAASLSSAALGGTINVGSKGTLAGYGSFGNINVSTGGTMVVGLFKGPRLDVASIQAEGLNLESGSKLNIAFNSDGAVNNKVSLINVSGNAVIGGTQQDPVLTFVIYSGSLVREGTYPVIIAGSDISYGSMAYASPQLLNYDITFLISPNNSKMLLMDVRESSFISEDCAGGALTSNGCEVFAGVHDLGADDLLFEKTMSAQRDEADSVLGQLSGDLLVSSDAAMVMGSRYVRAASGSRVRGISGGISTGAGMSSVSNYAAAPGVVTPFGVFDEDSSGIGLWTTGYGSWSKLDGDGNAAAITDQVGGFFLGGDFAAFSTMRFGALAGYGHSSYQVDANNAKGSSDDFTLGVYGGGAFGGLGVDFGAAYTWHDVSSRRDVDFSTLSERVTGSYNAGTFQLYGGIGYTFDITDSFQLEPFLDAAYIHQESDAFTETGGLAALSYMGQTMDTGFTTVGLRGAWEFALGSYQSQITASAGWQHAYGDLDPEAMVAFSGGDPFGVAGTPLAEDQAVLSVGWQTQFQDNVSLGLNYTGQFGDSAQSQNVTATLNIRF